MHRNRSRAERFWADGFEGRRNSGKRLCVLRRALSASAEITESPMIYYILKMAVSAALVMGVSEAAKRSGFIGGLIASLPIVSLLAIGWLYGETRDIQKVATLSWSIFWLVLPSLTFFAVFPILLRKSWPFAP